MRTTTVRLQPEVEKSLEALAGKLKRSKSWIINAALREFLRRSELEDTRWRQTLQAMESVAQGKAVAGDDVHAWLQSWGTPEEQPPPDSHK
jgi:predicted transcriptional regulator